MAFGEPDVRLSVEGLPAQIAEFDQIAVDEGERADAGSHQPLREGGAGGSDADDQRLGPHQLRLPLVAEGGE